MNHMFLCVYIYICIFAPFRSIQYFIQRSVLLLASTTSLCYSSEQCFRFGTDTMPGSALMLLGQHLLGGSE